MPRGRPINPVNVVGIRPDIPKVSRETKRKPKSKSKPRMKPVLAVLCAVIGSGIGILEVFYSWLFYSGQASSVTMYWCLGIGGAAISIMNMIVPPLLPTLKGERALLFGGILITIACFAGTVYADGSLASTTFGDKALVREDVSVRRTALKQLLTMIEADRGLVPNPLVLEQQIQAERKNVPITNLASSKDCTPSEVTKSFMVCDTLVQLRRSKAEAEDKIGKLDAKWAEYSAELKSLPALIAPVSALTQTIQVWAFAVLLSLSPGFLLAFARGLLK